LRSLRRFYSAQRRWRQAPWRLTVVAAATVVAGMLVATAADILPVTVVADIMQAATMEEATEVVMAAASEASMVTAAAP
jgi:hypothetical protein